VLPVLFQACRADALRGIVAQVADEHVCAQGRVGDEQRNIDKNVAMRSNY
jgi:hypothetical protein